MTAQAWPAAGTRVRVQPGQWRLTPLAPGHETHTIVIVSVNASDDPQWARVRGHGVLCDWPSSDCTQPCYDVDVDVDVLAAAGTTP